MPEWMATRILALLLGLSGGFAVHYTALHSVDPGSNPLTDDDLRLPGGCFNAGNRNRLIVGFSRGYGVQLSIDLWPPDETVHASRQWEAGV